MPGEISCVYLEENGLVCFEKEDNPRHERYLGKLVPLHKKVRHGEDPKDAARRAMLEMAGREGELIAEYSTIATGDSELVVYNYHARSMRRVKRADRTLHWLKLEQIPDFPDMADYVAETARELGIIKA